MDARRVAVDERAMDLTPKEFQIIEFFLLHNLVVDELRVLKRSKRVTPRE